jgi:hypothetical protein
MPDVKCLASGLSSLPASPLKCTELYSLFARKAWRCWLWRLPVWPVGDRFVSCSIYWRSVRFAVWLASAEQSAYWVLFLLLAVQTGEP